MPLPSSGQIAFSQLAAELGNACSNVSLRSYSACANLTSPDGITELYGKSCIPTYGAGAWSTGGNTTSGARCASGAGIQNDAFIAGGQAPDGGGSQGGPLRCTEEYNGTSWSTGNPISTGRWTSAAVGTVAEGLLMGGFRFIYDEFGDYAGQETLTCTEEYNGTSWSAGGALSMFRCGIAGAGTQNAGLAFGGRSSYVNRTCTEEYNGTSWSAGGALSTGRHQLAGAGTQNSGLAMGGTGAAIFSCTEEYNGTSWSAGGALIIARHGGGGAGTQNAGLLIGGNPGFTCTEEYNGTSWSAATASTLGTQYAAGMGSQATALLVVNCATREYNKSITGKCLG
jgi:hypothetical protein